MRTFEPGGTCWATSTAVLILVSDAIGSTRVGSRRHSTRPVSRSKSRPERGGCLKRARTTSRGSSRRTEGGGGAGAPPRTGAGAPAGERRWGAVGGGGGGRRRGPPRRGGRRLPTPQDAGRGGAHA